MTLRPLASLMLALLATLALAEAAAVGVQAFMRLAPALPKPPGWLLVASQVGMLLYLLAVVVLLYRRARMGKSAPPRS